MNIDPDALSLLHNLPQYVTSFVGRKHEQAWLQDLLAKPQHRLITVVGPGGVGKTRLVVETVARRPNFYVDGVFFVALADVAEPFQLVTAVAKTLDFPLAKACDPLIQLLDYLQTQNMLLICDNVEQLLPDISFFEAVLSATTGIKLLLTSRLQLNHAGETVISLTGLPCPDLLDHDKPDFADNPAVQLFVERAQRVQQTFDLHQANRYAVTRICQLVAGDPLALELAAGWKQLMSCQTIADQIQANLDILATDRRDVPVRQRSLRAVFEYSWQLFTESEQRLCRQLAIFPGSFDLEAVEVITDLTLPDLRRFVAQSWLLMQPNGRFSIHPLLQQYLRSMVDETNPNHKALLAHYRTYYSQKGDQIYRTLRYQRHNAGDFLGVMRIDIDNFRQTWDLSLTQTDQDITALRLLIRPVFRYYQLQGLYQEGIDLFAEATRAIPPDYAADPSFHWHCLMGQAVWHYHADQFESARQMLLTCLKTAESRPDLADIIPFCQLNLARIANDSGNYPEALTLAETCLAGYQAHETLVGTADACNLLGFIHWNMGEYESAGQWLDKALVQARRSGSVQIEADSLRIAGLIDLRQSAYATATSLCGQAYDLYEKLGYRRNAGLALANLGAISLEQGVMSQASDYLERALHLFRATNYQRGIAGVLNNLGNIAQYEAQYLLAMDYFVKARVVFQGLGDQQGESIGLANLGLIYTKTGLYEPAKRFFDNALQLCRQIGDRRLECNGLVGLSLWANWRGDYDGALRYSRQALVLAETMADPGLEAYAWHRQGQALTGLEKWQAAGDAFLEALRLREGIGQEPLLLESQAGLARVYHQHDQLPRAMQTIESILDSWQSPSPIKIEDVLTVSLICYQILHENRDERAEALLETAVSLLHARAAQFEPDSRMLRAFLHDIPVHRALWKLKQEHDKTQLSVSLTKQETAVMKLVGKGLSNRQIGLELSIKDTTVKSHLSRVYRKLNVGSRVQAVNRLRELGVLA